MADQLLDALVTEGEHMFKEGSDALAIDDITQTVTYKSLDAWQKRAAAYFKIWGQA